MRAETGESESGSRVCRSSSSHRKWGNTKHQLLHWWLFDVIWFICYICYRNQNQLAHHFMYVFFMLYVLIGHYRLPADILSDYIVSIHFRNPTYSPTSTMECQLQGFWTLLSDAQWRLGPCIAASCQVRCLRCCLWSGSPCHSAGAMWAGRLLWNDTIFSRKFNSSLLKTDAFPYTNPYYSPGMVTVQGWIFKLGGGVWFNWFESKRSALNFFWMISLQVWDCKLFFDQYTMGVWESCHYL